MNERCIDLLRTTLRMPLPGDEAHRVMLPPGRRYTPPRTDALPDARYRHSAVLVFLVPGDPCLTPMIRRTKDGGPHSGQIAFPGGAAEPGDHDAVETATREAEEEIGLSPGIVEPLGTLSPLVIDVSRYVITPVVATSAEGAVFRWSDLAPQESEVDEILRVPLRTLHTTRTTRGVRARGEVFQVPTYLHDSEAIWGASAMILAELFALCARIGCLEGPTGQNERSPGNR
jgi:8-oxo-dGTP pyrophosphatase MutT (NUDIX family)